MIDRRRFLLTSLAGPFAAPLAAEAQPGTPPRIALALPAVLLREMSRPDGASPALLRGLNELGYAEGAEHRHRASSLEAQWDRASEMLMEVIRLSVRVIVVVTNPMVRVARRATAAVPIVMVATDVVEDGLVASLARPGAT